MSAYGHQMEREISAQSLTSRGGSEIGSRYTVETGIYLSSFAAAILVSGLVTVGVLLATLLIAVTIMLKDCQSRSAGVVELCKSSDDYNNCKVFSLHAELNSLGAESVPLICKHIAVEYIKKGHYMKDLNITASLLENYLNSARPLADGLDVVLMDADELFPVGSLHENSSQPRQYICSDTAEEAKLLKQTFSLQLYVKLCGSGWPLILFSRKSENIRKTMEERLISAGCGNWSSLIMRLGEELPMNSREYISGQMNLLERRGFRIKAVISSQMDALKFSSPRSRSFRIPNPIYYNTMHHAEVFA